MKNKLYRPEVLIKENDIQKKVKELGSIIGNDFDGQEIVLVGLLKGCFVFMADLIRNIPLISTVDFMEVSSYGESTTSTGIVKIIKDLNRPVTGRHVLLVEDIIDSGHTLNHVINHLNMQKPASLSIAALLVKSKKHSLKYPIQYYCFDIDDQFVVGYGMDMSEQFRHLPYIGVIPTD